MILLAGFMVANTFYWNRIALLGLGLPAFPTKVNLILAGLKLLGILLLVPRYGYLASAALFAGYYMISTSLAAWKTYQVLKIRETTEVSLPDQGGSPSGPAVPPSGEVFGL